MSATIRHLNPDGLLANAAYTQVVAARGAEHVYIAGQVSLDAEGNVVGEGDLAAQTDQVMKNLGAALEAAGASFDDVVKITTYVVDYRPELRRVIAEARGRYLPAGKPPASTLVGVQALAGPEWLIEIEAIAVI